MERRTYVNIDAFELDDGTVYVKSSKDRIPQIYIPAPEAIKSPRGPADGTSASVPSRSRPGMARPLNRDT